MDPALPRPLAALAVCLALAALAGAASAHWHGVPADFDLRNYHLYDGVALLRGRIFTDLAPAQLQTYYAPLLDVLYVLALDALNRHPAALGAILALPQGLAAFLAAWLAARMLPATIPARRAILAACALAAVTGAAGASTFAGPMSEMLPASCVLGALLALGAAPPRPAWAGMLAGIAVGLKLTMMPFAAGLALEAAFARPPARARFAAAALAGAALTAGWWWAWLWVRFDNPIFPYFNDLFASPWGARLSGIDTRFLPRDIIQAAAYPLFWAFHATTLVTEAPARDPRIALGWFAVGTLLVRRETRSRARPMLCVWTLGYVLWEPVFSVLRYLASLELILPALLAALFAPVLARARPWLAACGAWALAVALIAATVLPEWGHAPPGPRAIAVRPPHFTPGTLVVLLDWSPMAYVAAFAPRSVRFVGADNNLVVPGAPDLLSRAVATAIRDQRGPTWGLEEDRATADRALAAYHLRRAPGCVRVRSNLDGNAIRACPLVRLRPPSVRTRRESRRHPLPPLRFHRDLYRQRSFPARG